MGMYDYDNTVLDGLLTALPSPDNIPHSLYDDLYLQGDKINQAAFIDELMLECGELEFSIPNITLARRFIKSWAGTQSIVWQNLYNTMYYKYNPIWNKDGTTETSRSSKNTGTGSGTKTITNTGEDVRTDNSTYGINQTRTDNLTHTTTLTNLINSEDTTNLETVHKVAGYNSNSLVNANSDITNGNVTSTRNGSTTLKDTGTVENTGNSTQTGTVTTKRSTGQSIVDNT